MNNKNLGWFMIGSLLLALFAEIGAPSSDTSNLLAFAWVFFSVWGAIRLIHLESIKDIK